MMAKSLRVRLVVGGLGVILVALTVAGLGLTLLFERHVARTLAGDLDIHLRQLLSGVDVDPQQQIVLNRPPADPRFADPLSGLYWQVSSDRGTLLRSRSLWDTVLHLPEDQPPPGETHLHEIPGPGARQVLIAERLVTLNVGGADVPLRMAVAIDLGRVASASSAFAKDLVPALALLGLVLAVAMSLQAGLGLRPLDALRRGIADIRSGSLRRLPSAVPVEVGPLVEEVNALLQAQEREIERSRARAADLAHGLKTPLAALAADAARLRERGEADIASGIELVGEAMSRQVDRELARARANAVRRTNATETELAPLVRSLISALSRTPIGAARQFEQLVPDHLSVPFDRTDLAEVMGNLLDNATRHAAARVRVLAIPVPLGASISIEDDGPGIAAGALARVLERGIRLDERHGGTGLGLAIVQDVLDAYGWKLELARSEMGGLKATLMPNRPAPDFG